MSKDQFITELQALGFNAQELPLGSNRIVFEFDIPSGIGPNQDKKIIIGTVVGNDYPATSPSSPYFKSAIVEGWVNTHNAFHPANVYPPANEFGPEWAYWSRKMTAWKPGDNARKYISMLKKFLIDM